MLFGSSLFTASLKIKKGTPQNIYCRVARAIGVEAHFRVCLTLVKPVPPYYMALS